MLLLSSLALHTKNILADPRASLMLDERKDGDPLEGARVMLMGTLVPTADAHARAAYLRRHPEAEMFAGFADFSFYRMTINRAHLVAGFGRIVDLAAQDILTEVSDAEALLAAEGEAIAHMNADHAEACRALHHQIAWGAERRLDLRRRRSGGYRVAVRPHRAAPVLPATGHRAGTITRGAQRACSQGACGVISCGG